MVEPILRLDIQPLMTYQDGKKRKTTLTAFDQVLQRNEAGVSDETEVQDRTSAQSSRTDAQTKRAAENVSENTAAQQAARTGFCDPVTGDAVQYVDVAETSAASKAEKEKDASGADSTSETAGASSGSSKTTTADAMKTTRYDAWFKKAAKKYNVSESLLKAIAKAESNFDADSVSGSGAMGVMQLMPATAESLGVSDPYDAGQNIMGGAKCIAQKLKEFNGDERMALAAYNAGSGAVRRYGGIPSYCKSYVNKVQSYKKAYETAKKLT